MMRLQKYLPAACGFAVLVVVLLLASAPAGQAVPSDKDVHVINTTIDPVPTAAQGTTTVSGNVSISNTPTVNLAGGASVNVANSAANPVPTSAQGTTTVAGDVSISNTPTVKLASGTIVNVAAVNPIPVSFTSQLDPFQNAASTTESGTNVSTLNVATVPAGKRLVIEFVSMTGQVPPGQHVEIMELTTSNGLGGISHAFVIHPQPDAVSGDALFRANQSLRLYANAGTQVTALFRRSSISGTANYLVTISGYLVDM